MSGDSERRPLVVANWKMNLSLAEAGELVEGVAGKLDAERRCEVGFAPTALQLGAVVAVARAQGLLVYGQNCHEAERGAFTGEVAATMLADAGADGVLVGHSERRRLFAEDDSRVRAKAAAAVAAGLRLILCVGETLEERESGDTMNVVSRQLRAGLEEVGAGPAGQGRVVVAYEPVWAIGTGRHASVEQIEEALAVIRSELEDGLGAPADAVRLLYGGSVSATNAEPIFGLPAVDGALVGSASLDPVGFASIVRAAG